VRRTAQLIALFPTATFLPIRGNLDTRLRKLDEGQFDAIVLASAGLRRLGFHDRISAAVPVDACVPAPGQGIIAVETRVADARVRAIVERLNDSTANAALDAERAIIRRLGGGCQMPIGAYASVDGSGMRMRAVVISLDGSRAARADVEGGVQAAEALGIAAAEQLLAQGAAAILADAERAHASVQGVHR
jgi:hydroxymethylbilane synthase